MKNESYWFDKYGRMRENDELDEHSELCNWRELIDPKYRKVLDRLAPQTLYMLYEKMDDVADIMKSEGEPLQDVAVAILIRNYCRSRITYNTQYKDLLDERNCRMDMVVLWEPKKQKNGSGWISWCYDRAKEVIKHDCGNDPGLWEESVRDFKNGYLTAPWGKTDYLVELPEMWRKQFLGWLEAMAEWAKNPPKATEHYNADYDEYETDDEDLCSDFLSYLTNAKNEIKEIDPWSFTDEERDAMKAAKLAVDKFISMIMPEGYIPDMVELDVHKEEG